MELGNHLASYIAQATRTSAESGGGAGLGLENVDLEAVLSNVTDYVTRDRDALQLLVKMCPPLAPLIAASDAINSCAESTPASEMTTARPSRQSQEQKYSDAESDTDVDREQRAKATAEALRASFASSSLSLFNTLSSPSQSFSSSTSLTASLHPLSLSSVSSSSSGSASALNLISGVQSTSSSSSSSSPAHLDLLHVHDRMDTDKQPSAAAHTLFPTLTHSSAARASDSSSSSSSFLNENAMNLDPQSASHALSRTHIDKEDDVEEDILDHLHPQDSK